MWKPYKYGIKYDVMNTKDKRTFLNRQKNLALAGKIFSDRRRQIKEIFAGLSKTGEVLSYKGDQDTDTVDISKQVWRQKINLGLLKHAAENNYKSILKDFLLVRLVMTKWRTPMISKKLVLKIMSSTRMYRVVNAGFLKLDKKGELWLVGQKTILNRFKIKDNRYVCLSLEDLKNLPRTILQVFAYENQERYSRDLAENNISECDSYRKGSQKINQRGTSVRLLAQICGLSLSSIQKYKDKSKWCKPELAYIIDNNSGHFKSYSGNMLRRCEHIFTGDYFIIYEKSTGLGYNKSIK